VPTSFSARYAPPQNDSECVKSGGAPVGSVIPGPSVTLCCR
jgi:hypothetical protein